MNNKIHTYLPEFLVQNLDQTKEGDKHLTTLLARISQVCVAIADDISKGKLFSSASVVAVNVQGEDQKLLDVTSNERFAALLSEENGLAGMVSEEMEAPLNTQKNTQNEKIPFLLVVDPLDGSSNIDVNVSVGSIFSILKTPIEVQDGERELNENDFLLSGTEQVAAGYAIYGPITMLVVTWGNGSHGFTLDKQVNEFVLTHPSLKIPVQTQEFAINISNSRFWQAPVQKYVQECLDGKSGVRGKDFNMRWIASLVAEAHRILIRGGVFLYPQDNKDSKKKGRLRLLYEANPIGMIVQQAGGRASTSTKNILSVHPEHLHERIGFIFGASDEVGRIERYHSNGIE